MNYKILNFTTLIIFLSVLGMVNWWDLGWYFLWIPVLVWLVFVALASVNIRWNFFLKSVHSGKTNERKIALTFDDGPHPVYTPQVLELLEKFDAKATFFCIGKNIQTHPEILKQILEKGHVIGNHSFSHSNFIGFNGKKNWLKELKQTDDAIEKITGFRPRFFRPPFGVTTPHLANAVRETNHVVIGWNVRPYDTLNVAPEKIIRKILPKIKAGSIVLLHDRHERIVPILEQLLPKLLDKKFTFAPLDKLIDENPYV